MKLVKIQISGDGTRKVLSDDHNFSSSWHRDKILSEASLNFWVHEDSLRYRIVMDDLQDVVDLRDTLNRVLEKAEVNK